LTDLVTDITQNGVESGASLVELEVSEGDGFFRFKVTDNGKGMTEEELKRAVDPFYTDGIKHPNRKVGLGLPFLIQTAQQSNGGWDVKSEKGKGTTVGGWFESANFDTPPVGDLPGMFRTILMFNSDAEIKIRRRKLTGSAGEVKDEYEIVKSEIVEAVGSLEEVSSLVMLGEYLNSLEEDEE
jgi:hypothetical protein